jgi:hypothetical protein
VNPVIEKQLDALIESWANCGIDGEAWYKTAAIEAVDEKRFVAIPSRDNSSLYLLRCWLTEPNLVFSDDGKRELESGASFLLHYFAQADDDNCLHDHPWDFTTDILAGGYVEHVPPINWPQRSLWGPVWDSEKRYYYAGNRVEHQAEDLHCVGQVQPGTFTLVRTGPRRRRWGFHPFGDRWIDKSDFFSPNKIIAASV